MDKYEYKVRAEEINSLIEQKKYAEAVKIADTIDWRRVKSVNMLCKVSELYRMNRRYEDSKEILLLADEHLPNSRNIIYSLCELSIKLDDLLAAVEYYKQFALLAPRDTGKFILQYRLYEAQDVSLEERIAVLEDYKKRDYREKWGYELAYLYHRIGLATKCVEECDELILWFGEGKYVIKAMELKMLHAPLTADQQEKYDRRFATGEIYVVKKPDETKEAALEKASAAAQKWYDTADLAPVMSSVSMETIPDMPIQIKSVEVSNAPTTRIPSKKLAAEISKEETKDLRIDLPTMEVKETTEDVDFQIKTPDVSKYNTINLQQELAKSLAEVMQQEDMEATDATKALPIDSLQDLVAGEEAISVQEEPENEAPVESTPVEAPVVEDLTATKEMKPITDTDITKAVIDEVRKALGEEPRDTIITEEDLLKSLNEPEEEAQSFDTEEQFEEPAISIAPVVEEESVAVPEVVEEPVVAPVVEEEPVVIPEVAEEPVVVPVVEEEPVAVPEVAEEPVVVPVVDEAPVVVTEEAAPALETEPIVVPILTDEEEPIPEHIANPVISEPVPVTVYEVAEEPVEAPVVEEMPVVAEEPVAVPEVVVEPVATPEVAVEPAINIPAGVNPVVVETGVIPEVPAQNAVVDPDAPVVEKQITGQLSFMDIMAEWEDTKKAAEQRRIDEMRKKVLAETGPLMQELENTRPDSFTLDDIDMIAPVVDVFDANSNLPEVNPLLPESAPEEEKPVITEEDEVEELVEIHPTSFDTTEINGLEEKLLYSVEKAQEDLASPELEPIDLSSVSLSNTEQFNAELERQILEALDEKEPEVSKKEPEEIVKEVQEESVEPAAKAPEEKKQTEESFVYIDLNKKPEEEPAKAEEEEVAEKPVEEPVSESQKNEQPVPEQEARLLTKEEKELFGSVADNKNIQKDIANTIDNISLDPAVGNVILCGEKGVGKSDLAKNLIQLLSERDKNFSGKIATVSGEQLNTLNIPSTLSSIGNGALIVQDAGDLTDFTLIALSDYIKAPHSDGLVIFLQGTKKDMDELMAKDAMPKSAFNLQVDIAALDNDGLVNFGKEYALSQEYAIDEMGVLALYTKIADRQTSQHAVTVEEVMEIVDAAIEKANKNSVAHMVDIIFGKRYDEEDMIILKEKDFS